MTLTDEDRYSHAVMAMVAAVLNSGSREASGEAARDELRLAAARCADPLEAIEQIAIGLAHVVAAAILHGAGNDLQSAREAAARMNDTILNGATR